LAAFEVAQTGGNLTKPFLLLAAVSLLTAAVAKMRCPTPKTIVTPFVCWAGVVTLYLGLSNALSNVKLIGASLVVVAILLYLFFPSEKHSG
jgi:hypothetical protein